VKPAIFKDKTLQEKFDRDGYVVFDFISAEQARSISEKFYAIHKEIPGGFYSEAFNPDSNVKDDIYHATDAVFDPAMDGTFHQFKKLGSTFLCKAPGEAGKVGVHQDWSVVDEDKYYSATIWVPTVDTTEENGALRVLPGSHKFYKGLRSPNIPFIYHGNEDVLWDNMITVPMKAGQAFVLNHAVIHGSSPNTTKSERLAIAYGLLPQEASLLFYHRNEENRIEKYEMPDDFFQRYYNVGGRPQFGKLVDTFDYPVPVASRINIESKINKERQSRESIPLFKDKTVQAFFDENGYAVLPALGAAEVSELLNFYNSLQLKDDNGFGFHISMDQTDKMLVGTIFDKLMEVAFPKMSVHFENSKAFVGSYVIKEPNPTGIVPVHQDWSFVDDEVKHTSLTCWVPLIDTTLDNGAMAVIKGSHRFFRNFRPSPSPQVPSPLSEHMFTIFPYLQLIEMKAGEMLVFDNRTFHGSPPNTSKDRRVAFGIGMTQQEAKLVHYYLDPKAENKDRVFKYAIDEKFFRKYENSSLSKMYDRGEVIEGYTQEASLPFVLPKFTSDELIELVKEHGNTFNVPLCEKLAKLFDYNLDGSKKPEPQPEPIVEQKYEEPVREETPWVWHDDRSFIQKYSPRNIVTEIKKRLVSNV
jgi:ectoine hydroxylase-related dioxygenase (phytanoyl-CoA dioxygenase family)